ncbi:MAG TPA: four helix bundle protein [Bacteroidia bacterium]|jgi:four helix bundle protein
MATIQKFEDMEVWQKARKLCHEIHFHTSSGSFEKDYKLRDQINGSSGSIMDNIAEGYERDGKLEFRQFLSIAKGSCGEVRSQLYRALDRKHITSDEFNNLKLQSEDISKQLKGFISYLNASEFKGVKFKSGVNP